jgi:hypothetical protein
MNIACIACPARYAIANDKVVGRKVRIGCKRCGTKLIIDGTVDPPSVRADSGVPSNPPPEQYHLAISHDQRDRADLQRIVELYARGAIGPKTLAWREGMSQWLALFEIEAIADALRKAGHGPGQPSLPGYQEDEVVTRVAPSGYGEEDEPTHVAQSPLEGSDRPVRFDDDDEDEATHVFDSEALAGAWSEPASWRPDSRQKPLGASGWQERGQSPAPAPAPLSRQHGGWEERGMEDDEVTRMMAPLDEQPAASPAVPLVVPAARAPMLSGPGFELRRPKQSGSTQPPLSVPSRPPARASTRPQSVHPDGHLTGERSENSVLFTLERLAKPKPAFPEVDKRAELDFSDVPPVSLGPPVAVGSLGSDLAVLAAPARDLPRPPPAASGMRSSEPELAAPRRSRFWVVLLVLIAMLGGAAVALRATGRWPLVTAKATELWQRMRGASLGP